MTLHASRPCVPYYSSAALADGTVVLGGRDKLVHPLDAGTGKARWTVATNARVESSPAMAGGRVDIGSNDGRLYVLDLATGQKVWNFNAGAPRLTVLTPVFPSSVETPPPPCYHWSILVKMPKTVNLYEAKTHLSELVERAARGEEVVIAKAGQPKARLVPITRVQRPRKPGAWKGRVVIAPDFDAPLPEDLIDAFEGRS